MSGLAAQAARIAGYDAENLPPGVAREVMLACSRTITEAERVPTAGAAGRVLAETIVAPFDVPPHDNAAMDGYAVRAADIAPVPATLRVVGIALAGRPWHGRLGPGECVRIMTGGAVPAGADSIVAQEQVRSSGDVVTIDRRHATGANLRRAGEDLRRGAAALEAGTLLGPAAIGLVASLGLGEVAVLRRLRVAHFSTGDEIASFGTPLAAGQLYDSNRYTIAALLDRLGVERLDLGVVPDDPSAIEQALKRAASGCDAIVTTGGISAGDADHVRPVLARLGEVLHWKLAMRPGRPFAFGRLGHAMLFGLPGNPVAAMVAFTQLVKQPLLRLAGLKALPEAPLVTAVATEPLRKRAGRTEFQRGIYSVESGRWTVRSSGDQGSGVLRSMAEANCFIVLGPERGNVVAGEAVAVQPFDWIH